jgi:hypothetical protein
MITDDRSLHKSKIGDFWFMVMTNQHQAAYFGWSWWRNLGRSSSALRQPLEGENVFSLNPRGPS